MNPAETVLARTKTAGPTLGAGRLICIDGPSGSGKSTLAGQLADLAEVVIVHTDDLCPGWHGIPELPRILLTLLAPHTSGKSGRYPRYDWVLGTTTEDLVVTPSPLLVLEGVGAGARLLAPITTTLVWLDGDPDLRRSRALKRDGETYAEHWSKWAAAEGLYFRLNAVSERADLSFQTA